MYLFFYIYVLCFPFGLCCFLFKSFINKLFFNYRLWSMADRSLLARTDLDQKIRSVSFSADSSHLAVGLGDGSFRVLKARLD